MLNFYITFSIITLISFSSVAQEYKGKFMVNASMVGASDKRLDYDDEKTNQFSGTYYFNLKVGYFFSNKSLFGISSGYTWDVETDYKPFDTITTTNKINSFDIGPFYKGYFKLVKNLYFTLNVSPFFRSSSLKKSFPDGEYNSYYSSKENAVYLSVLPGLSFDFSDKVSVEFELGFYNAYIKFRKLLDSPLTSEERRQVVYGTSTSLNEFDLNDILFGFTYRFILN